MVGFGKDGRGVIITNLDSTTHGAMAANTVNLVGTPLVLTEDFRMLRLEVFAGQSSVTAGQGLNQIFGIADGNLSQSVIENAIEVGTPTGPEAGQMGNAEVGLRPVYLLGGCEVRADQTSTVFRGDDGGLRMIWKKRWTFSRPTAWQFFVYNNGAAMTTGAITKFVMKAFGVWVE